MKTITPEQLSGPRCYFTDLDPSDAYSVELEIIRKLKLQLLLKGKVIVAASSLFHERYFNLISADAGLTKALQTGIIAPALRSEFHEIVDFFEDKKGVDYTESACSFYSANVKESISWSLTKNTRWFHSTFAEQVLQPNSSFRKSANISSESASLILEEIQRAVARSSGKFISREHINIAIAPLPARLKNQLTSLSNTLYRISGARVVNSEGHFPQSNIARLNITEAERSISDFEIFWSIFVERVSVSYSSAVKLSPDRLDRLSFDDILRIRGEIFGVNFASVYDELIRKTRASIPVADPDAVLLTQSEVLRAAQILRHEFNERITKEIANSQNKEGVLFEIGSAIETVSGGGFFSIFSLIGSIPKITTAMSKDLGEALDYRIDCAKRIVENLTGWQQWQRTALIDGYRSLLTYGLE